MILFIKGPLEVLNFFIDCMAEKISNPVIVDTSDKYIFFRQISLIDNMIDESTYVITFNNIGLNFTFGNKNENYWQFKNAKVYDILVDHPVNYMDYIQKYDFPNLNYITIDRKHCVFIKNNMPLLTNRTFFLPHGGKSLNYEPDKERNIDILYVGSCQHKYTSIPRINFMSDENNIFFYQLCYQRFPADL